MPQTTLALTVTSLPIPFPMIDPVEYKILEEQKTNEFGGNAIWVFYSKNHCIWYWRIFLKRRMWMILIRLILKTRTWTEETGQAKRKELGLGWSRKGYHLLESHNIPHWWKRSLAKGRCHAISDVRLGNRAHMQSKSWICRSGLKDWSMMGHQGETKLPGLGSVAEDMPWCEGTVWWQKARTCKGTKDIRVESRHAMCILGIHTINDWVGERQSQTENAWAPGIVPRHRYLGRETEPYYITTGKDQQQYDNSTNGNNLNQHE